MFDFNSGEICQFSSKTEDTNDRKLDQLIYVHFSNLLKNLHEKVTSNDLLFKLSYCSVYF